MKRVLVIAFGGSLAIAGSALAFHDGGVADCAGCHTMHNSEQGVLVDPDSPNGNPWLLRDATPSDVCLSCHATRLGAVLGADPLAPPPERGGGNFTFLLEDNINDGHGGATNPIPGEQAGHNLDAPGHGVSSDGSLTSGPGGVFPASQLGCTSCHDPHGNGDFRILNGIGPVQGGVFTFTGAAPVAVGINMNSEVEANNLHTAYQDGMSAWCGNCHGDFHANSTQLIHKSGTTLGGTYATAYGLYNGTGAGPGSPATSYLAAVPFEDLTSTTTSTAGPVAGSRVVCTSCHRAHASSAVDAGRWDFSVTFLHEDGDESGSYEIPDPYASLDQRSLCNKCHAKDN